jgi:Domain of unknown function (DUF4395)
VTESPPLVPPSPGQAIGTTVGPGWARKLFSFPNPVNEISARIVAGGVVVLAAITIGFDQPWLTVVLAYGFVARVLTGPKLSPLGQLSVRVLTPLLGREPRLVAGPPKRFAQGMGVAFSVTAAVLALGFGLRGAAYVTLGFLIVAAFLESALGLCLGCKVFGVLIRVGVIPEDICEACNNISLRPSATPAN